MFISEARAETDTITVQDTDALPQAPEDIGTGWFNVLPLVLVLLVFYFLLLKPQEKRRKEHEKMLSGVKRGEEIVTSSGIVGTVRKINDSDNTLMLEIASGVEIKILKSAVADILSRRKEGAVEEKPQPDDKKKKLKSKKK